jgi:hypothetical protein
MTAKVLIENAVLRGTSHPLDKHSQKVATVYFEGGEEFRVMAPSGATGDALEWLKYVEVRRQGTGGYSPVTDQRYARQKLMAIPEHPARQNVKLIN